MGVWGEGVTSMGEDKDIWRKKEDVRGKEALLIVCMVNRGEKYKEWNWEWGGN